MQFASAHETATFLNPRRPLCRPLGRWTASWLLAVNLLATLGCAKDAEAGSGVAATSEAAGAPTAQCADRTVPMINGAAGTYLIGEGPNREQFGKFAEQCAYQFDLGVLARELGDCSVERVTLSGEAPMPALINVSKSSKRLVSEARPGKAKAPHAWSWSGEALNCTQPTCDFDAFVQIELVRVNADPDAADRAPTMDACPWTEVRAFFELN